MQTLDELWKDNLISTGYLHQSDLSLNRFEGTKSDLALLLAGHRDVVLSDYAMHVTCWDGQVNFLEGRPLGDVLPEVPEVH